EGQVAGVYVLKGAPFGLTASDQSYKELADGASPEGRQTQISENQRGDRIPSLELRFLNPYNPRSPAFPRTVFHAIG
ncbi:MAG TPA: hypothetical protein VNB49_18155, partial [Candidatus Dormibacteraeota bacterium]|nr:hypothetical protein [Candidatus Dormibacteraeota bacterium]